MKKVIINDKEYELVKNNKEVFNADEVADKLTEYFETFDYVFGDYSYSKLRLKGYYASNNKNKTDINDIATLDNYIKNYCAFNCGYFLLKKIN